MKKKYLLLVILCFVLISCSPPQQRPKEDDSRQNNQGLQTNQSAVSKKAPVEYCRVTSQTADVKDGLGPNFKTIATLKQNDVVKVLDEIGDRYVIQLSNNQIGSIDTTSAEPIVREKISPQKVENKTPQGANTTTPPPTQVNIPDTFIQPDTLKPEGQPQADPQKRVAGNAATAGDLQSQAVEMVDLVNQERVKNGLPILEIDNEVARVAGIKSQDMVDNDYFSHYSPTYGSPFEMLDSFGVKYLQAGENLAGNSSVSAAHTALMNSSGHRQNILHPNFTHIGIGVRRSPRYGYIYTQMFISK